MINRGEIKRAISRVKNDRLSDFINTKRFAYGDVVINHKINNIVVIAEVKSNYYENKCSCMDISTHSISKWCDFKDLEFIRRASNDELKYLEVSVLDSEG
jgi:hypothetical protein